MTVVWTVTFLTMTPKAQSTKAKIDKWGCIKPKSFYIAKEIINRRNPWNGKIHVQIIRLIKESISKSCKNSCNSNQEPNNLIKKEAKDLTRKFSTKTYKWQRYLRRYSVS